MELITFVNAGARRIEMRIGGYWFVIGANQSVTLEKRDARLARAAGLVEVVA